MKAVLWRHTTNKVAPQKEKALKQLKGLCTG